MKIAEHLPGLAKRLDRCAVIRSMSTPEGDHGRATFLARTGYRPGGVVDYPALGASISKELADEPNRPRDRPARVRPPSPRFEPSSRPRSAPGSSARRTPRWSSARGAENGNQLTVRNLAPPRGAGGERMERRLSLLENFESRFAAGRPDGALVGRRTAYEKAVRMMSGAAAGAFDLSGEPDALRDRYGRSPFGQGCLLARRLVERGVSFVEVSLNGVTGGEAFAWDTHQDNFAAVKSLCEVLDPAWSTLLDDLKDRGLGDTLVVWMGEFGRTPTINPQRRPRSLPRPPGTPCCAAAGSSAGRSSGRRTRAGWR